MTDITISGENLYNKTKMEVKLENGKAFKFTIFPYFVVYSSKYIRSQYKEKYVDSQIQLDIVVNKNAMSNLLKIIHQQTISVDFEVFKSMCSIAVQLKFENLYPLIRKTMDIYKLDGFKKEFEEWIKNTQLDDCDEINEIIPQESNEFTEFIINLYNSNKRKAIDALINFDINLISPQDLKEINKIFQLPIINSFISYYDQFETQSDKIDYLQEQNNMLYEQIQDLKNQLDTKIQLRKDEDLNEIHDRINKDNINENSLTQHYSIEHCQIFEIYNEFSFDNPHSYNNDTDENSACMKQSLQVQSDHNIKYSLQNEISVQEPEKLLATTGDETENEMPEYIQKPGELDTSLIIMARKGQYQEFVREIKNGRNVNNFDNDERTPLHIAAITNRADIIDFLLERDDINPNIKDKYGKWPLYYAIESSNFEVAMKLVESQKIHLDMKMDYGQTILHLSARKNASLFLEKLFQYLNDNKQAEKHRNIDINTKDQEGKTAIHIAAQKGNALIIKTILQYNPSFNINSQDESLRTPLHWAVSTNRKDVVSYLINCPSINVNLIDENGKPPAFLAVQNNYISIIQIIVSCPKFDPNTKDKDGNTLLIICAQKGNINMAQELAKHPKINFNCKDKFGRTPLHITAQNKKILFFKWLLEQDGVDINIQDNMKRTPLHIAAMSNEECVKALLEVGKQKQLNTHIQDSNGKIPSAYCKSSLIANEIEKYVYCKDEIIDIHKE